MSDLTELPGSSRQVVGGAKRTGEANPHESLLVTVVVRRRIGADLSPAAPPPPHSDLAAWRKEQRAGFAARAGADPGDLQAVAGYATSQGLRVVSTDPSRRSVTLEGSVAQVSEAFGVTLGRYQVGDGTSYRGREGAVRVPTNLVGIVEAVLGLDDRPQARPHHRRGDTIAEEDLPDPGIDPGRLVGEPTAAHAVQSPNATPLWATQVAQLYSFPTNVKGGGETIGLIELGGGFSDADLNGYFAKAGLSRPAVLAVPVDGGSNAPGVDPNADGEVLLDIEVSGSIAPEATIVVYFADSSDRGFVDAVTSAVHDQTNAPSVISISWGGPEDSWTPQAIQSFQAALADAASMGVTVLCAAGDHGAGDAAGDGRVHADYPASSPQAVACGGTTLIGSGGVVVSEIVWNDGDGWATGGGISDLFAVPGWQTVPMPPNLNGTGKAGRGVPDVAGNADITSGYLILVDGKWGPTGGTSAVAPLYAGLVACINQGVGRSVGELSPLLYSAASLGTVFRDVTSGDNSVPASTFGPKTPGYVAYAGWDPCSGLGSVRGDALMKSL